MPRGYALGASNDVGVRENRFGGRARMKIAALQSFEFLTSKIRPEFAEEVYHAKGRQKRFR